MLSTRVCFIIRIKQINLFLLEHCHFRQYHYITQILSDKEMFFEYFLLSIFHALFYVDFAVSRNTLGNVRVHTSNYVVFFSLFFFINIFYVF